MNTSVLEHLLNRFQKVQLTPSETSEITGRSIQMLQKDRTDGVGIEYIKMGKGKNSKVFYPIKSIADFLENNTVKTV